MKDNLASCAELATLVAVCVLASAFVYSIATIRDPVWWILAVFLGLFWGGIVAVVTSAVLFGVLCVVRILPYGGVVAVVTGAAFAGAGTLAFTILVLGRDVNEATIVACLTVAAAASLLYRRLRGREKRRNHRE